MNQSIQNFIDNLPAKPFCSDNLQYGIKVRPASTAVSKKYVQHNHPEWLTCLVFDIDRNAYDILEDTNAKPNLAIFNRKNLDSAHFAYFIETPVNTGINGRLKPIQFAKNIENGLLSQLNADPNYTGLLVKNPTHQDHYTINPNTKAWTLNHLADFVDLTKKPERLISEDSRHLAIFDIVRFKAYSIVEDYRETGAFEVFSRVLQSFAEEKNHFIDKPSLTHSSLKAIVKSVAKWTFLHYQPQEKINRGRDKAKNTHLNLKDKQVFAALNTHKQRQEATERSIREALEQLQAKGVKITQKAIAEQSGLTDRTVRKYRHLLK